MDERTRSALARLTANERECLRRRLLPQTAKEMAIDLGVSPHAVEKRLKMARAKLGVSSSLAAARLLAAAEGYDPPVPRSPDLAAAAPASEDREAAPHRHSLIPFGAALMILLAAAAFALLPQSGPTVSPGTMIDEKGHDVLVRQPNPDQARAYLSESFDRLDRDRSGDLASDEVAGMEPGGASRDKSLPPAPAGGRPDLAAGRKWLTKLDRDRDGRVSRDEYIQYMLPWMLWQGLPADWHGWSPRPG